jgi:hypothetical protein
MAALATGSRRQDELGSFSHPTSRRRNEGGPRKEWRAGAQCICRIEREVRCVRTGKFYEHSKEGRGGGVHAR